MVRLVEFKVARRRKSKYKKTHIEMWRCRGCEFEWTYKTFRCPICADISMAKII